MSTSGAGTPLNLAGCATLGSTIRSNRRTSPKYDLSNTTAAPTINGGASAAKINKVRSR
jgi:hypothetical protein